MLVDKNPCMMEPCGHGPCHPVSRVPTAIYAILVSAEHVLGMSVLHKHHKENSKNDGMHKQKTERED